VIGDEEKAAEAFEGEAANACLELMGGGGDEEEVSFFASSLGSAAMVMVVVCLGAHYILLFEK